MKTYFLCRLCSRYDGSSVVFERRIYVISGNRILEVFQKNKSKGGKEKEGKRNLVTSKNDLLSTIVTAAAAAGVG